MKITLSPSTATFALAILFLPINAAYSAGTSAISGNKEKEDTYTNTQKEVDIRVSCQKVFLNKSVFSMRVEVSNKSKQPISIGYMDDHSPFYITVKDKTGDPVELTDKGQKIVGLPIEGSHKYHLINVDPGGSYLYNFDLKELFILKNGETYNLTVASEINTLKPGGFVIESGAVPFSIQ